MHTKRILALASLVTSVCGVSCQPPDQGPLDEDTEVVEETAQEISWGSFPPPGATTLNTPIGIALEIDQGQGVPLKVRRGQRVYINQIDMRAAIDTTVDEGVAGLNHNGDFASLDWGGIQFEDESYSLQQNPDGTFVRRRFYRGADWMDEPSAFIIEQINNAGVPTTYPIVVDTGLEHHRTSFDSFFVRRLRAIQWTYNCESSTTCEQGSAYGEEALVELRHANGPNLNFVMQPTTTALRVRWSSKWSQPYTIPVQQVENPEWDYGFDMSIAALTPPGEDGVYAAGDAITFQFTLKDGAGNPLHEPGILPSYNDFLAGNIESGINYYRGFSEPYATYYRRKHREKQLVLGIVGPIQNNEPIRSVLNLFERMDFSTGIITAGTQSEEGVYAAATGIPSFAVLFGGPQFWDFPTTDTWTFTLPPDSAPGTYYVVLKGRRSYLGEDIPKSTVLPIQVGTTTQTTAPITTGNCSSCHTKGGKLDRVLHGMDNRGACNGACHAPLSFELEGPVYARTHFIHSRSNRFDAPLEKCQNCHLEESSIQRTSKSACLSCHSSYPQSHVEAYGPIVDMYVGGREESFQQCSTACHTTHPGAKFKSH